MRLPSAAAPAGRSLRIAMSLRVSGSSENPLRCSSSSCEMADLLAFFSLPMAAPCATAWPPEMAVPMSADVMSAAVTGSIRQPRR